MNSPLKLRVGELVQVKSKTEILATLGPDGRIDGLPFMPEMFEHCGKTFRVYKRADKTCDTVNRSGSRRMRDAVHLEGLRCDGSAHGGCQAACMIFWKEAWLRRVGGDEAVTATESSDVFSVDAVNVAGGRCSGETVYATSRKQTNASGVEEEIFFCQATELPKATTYLAWWDVRQYMRDVGSGNIGAAELNYGFLVASFNFVIRNIRRCAFALRSAAPSGAAVETNTSTADGEMPPSHAGGARPAHGWRRFARLAFEKWLVEYPSIRGSLRRTPSLQLNLQPGELVQIRSKEEIVATLDVNNRNRGLSFDGEMVPYCGGTYKVLSRVDRILDERTGKMLTFPDSCIVLDEVICNACLSRNRMFCPRSTYSYWHEIWLKRAQ